MITFVAVGTDNEQPDRTARQTQAAENMGGIRGAIVRER
jgi:hypothetical protein